MCEWANFPLIEAFFSIYKFFNNFFLRCRNWILHKKIFINFIKLNIPKNDLMLSKQFLSLNKALFNYGFATQKIKVKNPVAELDGD